MDVKVEKPAKSEQKLTIELTELEMEKYYDRALTKFSKEINVKGFRPGKIPKDVVIQHVNEQAVWATAADMALPPTYSEALQKEKVPAIGRPKVEILSLTPLKYTAIVPIYPEVKVDGYKKIKLIPKKVELTEEEVKEEIGRLQKMHSTFVQTDEPAKIGDRVEIDFDGFDEEGVQLDNTSSKNHPLVLGDKSFIPGFEEQVVGMKTGEKKEIKVTFPADYFHEPFRNKVVIFKVKLVRHEIMHTPEIDEKFTEKVTGKPLSAKDFDKKIREDMMKNKEYEEKNRIQGELMSKLSDLTKVEIPQTLLDEEIEHLIHAQKHEMQERGVDWKQYLDATQQTEDQVKESKKEEASKRLTVRFGLQEVFKEEKIEIPKKELEEAFAMEMQMMAAFGHQPNQEQLAHIQLNVEHRLKIEKLVESLTSK